MTLELLVPQGGLCWTSLYISGFAVCVIFQIVFSFVMMEINKEVQNLLPWDIVALPVNLYSVQWTFLPLWSVIRRMCIDRSCLCGSRISIIAPQVRRSILWVVWDNVLMFRHTASIETVLFESILTRLSIVTFVDCKGAL